MLRTPIARLADGQSVRQSFRAADKQLRVNRNGGKYLLLKLSDASGSIAAMMWNAEQRHDDAFDRGDYVICEGRTQIHNGSLQIIATAVDRIDPADVDAADFEAFDADAADQTLGRLRQLVATIKSTALQQLTDAILADDDFMASFTRAAAAVSNHHAYPGGLLRHTVDMMELVNVVAPRYEKVDRDLLMVGAMLHDFGKTAELSADGETYTDRGQLVGHIVIGYQLLGAWIDSLPDPFPPALRLHLEHLIVSHHGELEYGSPRVPATLEAVALHHIDNLDAKMSSYASVIDADVAPGDWTNYVPAIGRKLYKGPPVS